MRARMRARARPPLVEGSPLGNEQTWMRVVLAERLRWLLARDAAAPTGPLAAFANWFAEEADADDAPKVLTHRLTDRKHRHELLRFADALRRPPPPDIVEEAVEAVEEEREDKEARAAVMVAGNRRLRRKRRKRERAGLGASSGARARRRARRPLPAESDEWEAAARVVAGRARPGPSDDAFVENPFH